MDAIFSVLPIYFFILLGFIAKRVYKDDINERTLVLLSLYFFQPILIFWGLTKSPINYEFIASPLAYLSIVLILIVLLIPISMLIFKQRQEQSIYLATALVGNTGNLGIPLGIALFGIESVPYTSIINIANIFFIYIFSVYFFAREHFKLKDALLAILKIPGIWFAILALIYNYNGFTVNKYVYHALEMGSYTSMVIQLIIFGIYLSSVKVKSMPWRTSLHVSFVKHIILPLSGILFVLYFTDLNKFVASILIMELMMPLAVNNVNIAALYHCKPYEVAASILVSSTMFVIFLYFYMQIIDYLFR